ncbi:MAG: anhydro-N-acetylmuramic acid kinase [Pseudomonadota bacterium]|nr:anhydro-N-acetylmuramic acid kinase [Pseudomonadota bacterium]
MTNVRRFRIVGLMSGTSMDGVDVALIETDGRDHIHRLGGAVYPYPVDIKEKLMACVRDRGANWTLRRAATTAITEAHIHAVRALLETRGADPESVDLIGFHGHTVDHCPAEGRTVQIGDADRLAGATGIDVVCDFRQADVLEGGHGAPLAPVYHRALTLDLIKPVAVLNIGGIANLTWIGHTAPLLACDTGPGNAPIDDWVRSHGRGDFDTDGRIAASGKVNDTVLQTMLADSWFDLRGPKSLDRGDVSFGAVEKLSLEDGAATLTALAAHTVAKVARGLPEMPHRLLVTGGGRRNPVLMRHLAMALKAPVQPVEAIGLDGDLLEAELMAYLAARHRLSLALTYPETTGVRVPMTGGRFVPA